jgi:hypothetical protein
MMKYAWLLIPLLLAGCGETIPLWSTDYARQATTHRYADVPPAKALAAAEEVVRLTAPPRNVEVRPSAGGAILHRYYNGLIGFHSTIIDYRFAVDVAPEGRGSVVRLAMRAEQQDLSSDDTVPGFRLSPLLSGSQIRVADPYRLFFARMDYLLGKRPDWVSCAAAPSRLGASMALDPLCFKARDAAPAAGR